MTDKIDRSLSDELRRLIDAALADDETQKAIKKRLDDVAYEFQWRVEGAIKDDLAANLSAWVSQLAESAVEQVLAGNEDQLRRYLSCEKRGPDGEYIGWTGRTDGVYWGRQREDHEQHPVIHGRLFEQGAVELRKKIVNAHRDLLVNERILDLEDQVKSLVAQVNKANEEKEAMWQRVRERA